MASLVQKYNDEELARWEVGNTVVIFGRSVDATVFIEDPSVSRAHCQVEKTDAGFMITDLDSHNGTFVNGQRIMQARLKNGDEIVVGKYIILFENPQTLNQSDMVLADTEARHDPAVDEKAWYLTVKAKNFEQTTFLKNPDYLIGKSDDCDIELTGWKVSPIHAMIVKQGAGLCLLNVADNNKPLEVNGKPALKKHDVKAGDSFMIGGYELTVFTKES